MPNRPYSISPIVAYASLAVPSSDQTRDLELLRRWCSRFLVEIEVLAEEIPPSAEHRPLWFEILEQIARGNITTLIVPSLFHIAGADFIALSKVLTLLKAHGVTLKSLGEVIDSRRNSNHEIVLRLVENTRGAEALRGAQ